MGAIVGTQTEQLAAHEAALLAQVAAGDRGGPLIELYDRYSARVYGLGLRLLGDRGMAEELVQDTFVRLWRSADRFDAGRGSVRTFLFAIARRAAVDLLRRPTSRPLQTTEFPDELTSDPAYEQLLLGLDVRDALNSLSPKHREMLECYYDHDLTQQQIADRLTIPLGTVKTRTYHALRALRRVLEERGLVA